MTRLFIALSFLVTFSTLTAQESFNGMWESDTSSYITTILASDYSVLEVYNTSFVEYRRIDEKITSQSKSKFTTELYNPENGYTVKIKYNLKDPNTIVSTYSGDMEGKYILNRIH